MQGFQETRFLDRLIKDGDEVLSVAVGHVDKEIVEVPLVVVRDGLRVEEAFTTKENNVSLAFETGNQTLRLSG